MSNRLADMDQDAVSAFKDRIALKKAERAEESRKQGKPRKHSKLAERARREADAFHYGDGRRRRAPRDPDRVQLNCEIRTEAKEVVRTIAIEDDEDMRDTVEKAIFAYHDLWQAKRGKGEL